MQRRARPRRRLRPRQPDAAPPTAASRPSPPATRWPGSIDGYERELGEGPCIDAIADASVFHDADLTDGSPWPRLTERVLAQTPVRGMAGFRLRVGDEVTGALNLFSDTADGAEPSSPCDQGIVLASFVTVALRRRPSSATRRSRCGPGCRATGRSARRWG